MDRYHVDPSALMRMPATRRKRWYQQRVDAETREAAKNGNRTTTTFW